MNLRLIIPIIVLCCSGLSAARSEGLPKKLIEYGWDVPSPDFVQKNIREMEKRPFDGVIMRLNGGMNVFLHKPLEAAKFEQDLQSLRATEFSQFTDNFILMLAATDEGWDWFSESDWKASEQNIRLFAKAARAGRCVGVCFDPEPYGRNPWLYGSQSRAKDRSFAEFEAQARRRGARFIRILQKEVPGVKVITFFQLSLFGHLMNIPDPEEKSRALAKEYYGLLPAFLNGMLDAARPGTVVIDGNENAYYYTASEPFFRSYHLIRQSALAMIDPKNRTRYGLQVQAGQALYMDQLFALRQPEKGFISYYMTPEERARWFEHNVYYALHTTDEYVWCYSERVNWWQSQVPEGAEAAIRSAREKLRQGKPLGFGIEDTTRAAEKRMQERAEADIMRRKAIIPKLSAQDTPPVIDGKLDDILWQTIKPLEPFLPALASGQEKTQAKTTAQVAYDSGFLYTAFRCEEPQVDKLAVSGEKRDDSLWMGDVVELFIAQADNPERFYQFMVNPKGVLMDQTVSDKVGDLTFSPDVKYAAARGEKEWTVEMAVPWSAIGGPPQPGERRRANTGRERQPTPELSTWSQVITEFLSPGQFGEWTFGS
ncbi:MAG: hypothetical protein IT210_11145 [Armatimonadetes bacterium]|nr:hypothetical protein [Armatimonadota bacterium]